MPATSTTHAAAPTWATVPVTCAITAPPGSISTSVRTYVRTLWAGADDAVHARRACRTDVRAPVFGSRPSACSLLRLEPASLRRRPPASGRGRDGLSVPARVG